MKVIKLIVISFILAFTNISCNNKHGKQHDKKLEEEYKQRFDNLINKKDIESDIDSIKIVSSKNNNEIVNGNDWKAKAKAYLNAKEGDTLIFGYSIEDEESTETNYQGTLLDLGNTSGQPSIEDFEYSAKWRTEAYKATKKYIAQSIKKKYPECTIIAQGSYQPNLVRYVGGYGYLVKSYCEFNCNKGYDNPSYFWVEVKYLGHNTWDCEIINQKFVD